jgi:hypothetical protein
VVLVSAGFLKDALLSLLKQRMAALPLSLLRHLLGNGFAKTHLGKPHEPAI